MPNIFQTSLLGGVEVGITKPVRIVGVINLSPESFYKDSVVRDVDTAFKLATEMVEEGADIIDVGGMSTAPYKETYISPDEELRRIKPVLKELASSLEVPISIDTRRSVVADEALKCGANIVNDTSGLNADDRLVNVVKEYGASLIIMAYGNVESRIEPIINIRRLLRKSLDKALSTGIEPNKIVIDPGIGFFRDTGIPWYEWDANVLRNLRRLYILGRPILVGVSRKSFIGAILNQEDPGERLVGSLASEAIAVYNGASLIRTHSVRESLQAVRMAEFIRPKPRIYRDDRGFTAIDLDNLFNRIDLEELMLSMDVDVKGARIMGEKGEYKVIMLEGVPRILSIVLKQEMLAAGGEAALPKDAIFSGFDETSVLLMGTVKQLKRLVDKLYKMHFKSLEERNLVNTSDIAKSLEDILAK